MLSSFPPTFPQNLLPAPLTSDSMERSGPVRPSAAYLWCAGGPIALLDSPSPSQCPPTPMGDLKEAEKEGSCYIGN